VGDAEFQKKCLGKMKDVTSEGRTVLFVSHNMPAVKSFCSSAVLLQNGKLITQGKTDEVISKYMSIGGSREENYRVFTPEIRINDNIKLYSFSINKPGEKPGEPITIDSPIEINTELEVNEIVPNFWYDIGLQFKNDEGEILFVTGAGRQNEPLVKKGRQLITCHIPANFFNSGIFYINFQFGEKNNNMIFREVDIIKMVLLEAERPLGSWMGSTPGFLRPKFEWKSKDIV
jgi:lipopolysaccharide transport system ATP-binding protein